MLLDKTVKKDAILFTYLSDPIARQHYQRLLREDKLSKDDTTEKKIKLIHDEIMKNLEKIGQLTQRDLIPIITKNGKPKQETTAFMKKLKNMNKYAGELYKISHLKAFILKLLKEKKIKKDTTKKELDELLKMYVAEQKSKYENMVKKEEHPVKEKPPKV